MITSETILESALKLKPEEKMHIIETLIESMSEPDEETEQLWIEEAEKRYQAYKMGKTKVYSLEEVLDRIK